MHPARHTQTAKGLAPGDGIGLGAGGDGERIGRPGPPADEAVNSLLRIDKRLFHGLTTLDRRV